MSAYYGLGPISDLPRELRDQIYDSLLAQETFTICDDPDDANLTATLYASDAVSQVQSMSKLLRRDVYNTPGKPTLARATDMGQLLRTEPITSSVRIEGQKVAPCTIKTIVMPTKIHSKNDVWVYPLFDQSSERRIPRALEESATFKDLSVVALDDRLLLNPVDPNTRFEKNDRKNYFSLAYQHATKIAEAKSGACTVYVNTDREDWTDKMLDSTERLVWQGTSSIPRFAPVHLNKVDNTFLLDLTEGLWAIGYDTGRLVSRIEQMCRDQYTTMSGLKRPESGSRALFHLTVDQDDERAVQALEQCQAKIEELGKSTRPEGSEHTVEIKVGGKHVDAPIGYRVMNRSSASLA